MDVQGKRVLVVGLARSGLAVACALVRRGAVVTVTDRKPPAEFAEVLPQLLQEKVGLELGSQSTETFLRHEIIVISPGVPWDLPQLVAARERKIPVYPEVEAASWFLEGTLVGVTGSNGKTTTTALLGDMLRASGFPTFVGGNIGNALSSAVGRAQPGTRFVAELSSFQLEGIHEFRSHVAVMLNLSPNHLDRHPNLEAYAQAKRRIFRNQRSEDFAVLNADDPWVAGLEASLPSQAVFFSRRRELPDGVFVSGGKIHYRVRHLERVLFETRDVTLRGDFNLENVLAATAAACMLGADFMAIRQAVRAFQAVEHRLEFVQEIQGVDFYNNSKATSVDATVKSLGAFERGVHLIMGGKDKGAPYAPLLPLIRDRVREVLLIGAAAPVIAQQLAGQAELVQAGDLATAVYEAFGRSRPGDTVLLAPACSSFDQFKDYEERGRVFKELVRRLANEVAEGRVVRSPQSEVRSPGPEPSPGRITFAEPPPASAPTAAPRKVPLVAAKPAGPSAAQAVAEPVVLEKAMEASGPAATQPSVRTAIVGGARPAETGHEKRDTGYGIRDTGHEKPDMGHARSDRDSESGIRDKGFPPSANPEPKSPRSELPVPSPESRAPSPVSHIPSSPSRVPAPEPPAPSPSRHMELKYVYEVDAVETPASESQVVPEDEPAISISASTVEALDDEAMPFESRPGKEESGVLSPKSEVQAAGPNPQHPAKQPKLFKSSEE
ncbi:MAG: UDP-N-acetylmuramoyl-L-alanine--D-glutamate ligase [Terriglobia bacterium]